MCVCVKETQWLIKSIFFFLPFDRFSIIATKHKKECQYLGYNRHYLPGKDPTDSNDAEDIEYCRPNNGPNAHVSLGDKHSWLN